MKQKTSIISASIIVLIFFASSLIFAQPAGQLKQRYEKKEVYITMRDGVRLFTSIYSPTNKSITHPVLLNRTPYNIEPGGVNSFNSSMYLYKRYTDEEYIMVFQDVGGNI